MPKLENWAIRSHSNDPFQAPELQSKYLTGTVYDNSNFKDGSFIKTSRVQEISEDQSYAKTLNTTYMLGEPHPDYVEYLNSQSK